jgi:hypothetical protein
MGQVRHVGTAPLLNRDEANDGVGRRKSAVGMAISSRLKGCLVDAGMRQFKESVKGR